MLFQSTIVVGNKENLNVYISFLELYRFVRLYKFDVRLTVLIEPFYQSNTTSECLSFSKCCGSNFTSLNNLVHEPVIPSGNMEHSRGLLAIDNIL